MPITSLLDLFPELKNLIFPNTLMVLLIPMLIAYILLIIHALYAEGKKFTLTFFGGFLIYGVIREFIVSHTASPYQFNALNPIFQIINIPIAIGWSFACYLSYWFGKWIIFQFTEEDTVFNRMRIATISGLFVIFITFAIEYTGSRMRWWDYNPVLPPGHLQVFGVYLFLFVGWAVTVLAFLFPFQFVFYAEGIQPSKKLKWFSISLIPTLYIGLVIGNYIILYATPIPYYIFLITWIPILVYLIIRFIQKKRSS